LQKRVEHEPHQRAMRSDNCKSYRTYDSASGTYRATTDSAVSADRFPVRDGASMRTRFPSGSADLVGTRLHLPPGLSNVLTPLREKENQLSAFVKGLPYVLPIADFVTHTARELIKSRRLNPAAFLLRQGQGSFPAAALATAIIIFEIEQI